MSWHNQINNLQKIDGCILSNELLDNFPVHQVILQNELMEVFVGYDNGFFELLKPAPEALKEYLRALNIVLAEGFRTEINLHVIEWINQIASKLNKGFVLTIDYGFLSPELYARNKSRGTLLCYHKHSINDNPYINIGKQDITAHVNFSALGHFGSANGLQGCGFTLQSHFLHALGITGYLRDNESINKCNEKIFLLQKLLLSMGGRLKVMIQQKGMPLQRPTGMQFSQRMGA